MYLRAVARMRPGCLAPFVGGGNLPYREVLGGHSRFGNLEDRRHAVNLHHNLPLPLGGAGQDLHESALLLSAIAITIRMGLTRISVFIRT